MIVAENRARVRFRLAMAIDNAGYEGGDRADRHRGEVARAAAPGSTRRRAMPR